jgi:hypothetical protein
MMRKPIPILLAILLALSFIPTAQAAGASGYSHSVSATSVGVGESVHLTLTTPVAAEAVRIYLDGRWHSTPDSMTETETAKVWETDIMIFRTGTHKVQFFIYGQNGKLLARYPRNRIIIKVVKQTEPTQPALTQGALVMEYDMAVLQAVVPVGTRCRRTGFYLGTSEAALTADIRANGVQGGFFSKLVKGLAPQTTYYYQAYAVSTKGALLKGDVKSFATPAQAPWTAEASMKGTIEEKYDYLFRSQGRFYTMQSRPLGYMTLGEAASQMVTFRVPVWVINGDQRIQSSMPLTVNRKLAESVKAIFNEIFALDMHFPFISVKGFSYRKVSGPGLGQVQIMSHHAFGAAIDINKAYNKFFLDGDARDPNNPYYIPQQVIDIFARYGWSWGGNFAYGQDTMHFQYLGLDLIP